MLRVIEYFAKPLKIIQNNTLEWVMCKSLLNIFIYQRGSKQRKNIYKHTLVFHCNYIIVLYRFWDIQVQIMAWP